MPSAIRTSGSGCRWVPLVRSRQRCAGGEAACGIVGSSRGGNMATQLLIYETAVPVSAARHRDASVEVGADYAFARSVNSVPLMAVEFPHAAPEYAIVFAGAGE